MSCSIKLLLLSILFIKFIYCEDDIGQTRVIGGKPASEIYPYQISLQVLTNQGLLALLTRANYRHICGGSIINENYVVTAAHCVSGGDKSQMTIYAGSQSTQYGGERYPIESIVIHPGYKELVTNDIALIRISNCFKFDDKIKSIEFRNRNSIQGGSPCKLSGWGVISPYIQIATTRLYDVELKTITNAECVQSFNVTDNEVCTIGPKGACSGDSGGPLVSSDKTLLVGVVSYGNIPCGRGTPTVFTRVSQFIDWIESEINQHPATC